ncbi:hypothetical protein AB0K40_43365 [Nonomuraea bangladeshensis]|uniref:Uncharacterized protein n=1 Tax=Nonomuraea bangladeshensis TaxID=404385 RepID=A0ABV3HJV9_9ACTN
MRISRRSAAEQRADVQRQIKILVVTAPDDLRAQLRHLTTGALITICAAFHPDPARAGEPETATRLALRLLARRHQTLTDEISQLDTLIAPLVEPVNSVPDDCRTDMRPHPASSLTRPIASASLTWWPQFPHT